MVADKAGVREASESYNDRYNIKIAHGYRKYFSSTLSSIKASDGSINSPYFKMQSQ